MNKKLQDAMLQRQVKQAGQMQQQVEQVAALEIPFASDFVLAALQQMGIHRRAVLPPGPLMITAELCHLVTMRAVADMVIGAILQQQPGMAGLVDPISQRVRQIVHITPNEPKSALVVPPTRAAAEPDPVEPWPAAANGA